MNNFIILGGKYIQLHHVTALYVEGWIDKDSTGINNKYSITIHTPIKDMWEDFDTKEAVIERLNIYFEGNQEIIDELMKRVA